MNLSSSYEKFGVRVQDVTLPETLACENCNKSFELTRTHKSSHFFCSTQCLREKVFNLLEDYSDENLQDLHITIYGSPGLSRFSLINKIRDWFLIKNQATKFVLGGVSGVSDTVSPVSKVGH